MPVAVDNNLLHIQLDLGPSLSSSFPLGTLLDTGGALNTGYLTFHLWLASTYSESVHSLEFFDGDNPFEPIKLSGALLDPASFDAAKHGLLTAIIRYTTPYTDSLKQPVLISYALGPDVSHNAILGLPTIDSLEFLIDTKSNTAHSRLLNTIFPLERRPVSHGLPPRVTFDADQFRHSLASAPASMSSRTSGPAPFQGPDIFSDDPMRRTLRAPIRSAASS